ncbi:Collagen alpha-1(I) chain [Frankliniella fusca]|uniref:Collagen alpha-1(I) chain n=1 Tax=Frankliniella fusca TaxID=407009 RepID=A0AAE1GPK9_9NEOP|nr:Collagen alpha-1(I) chain [Frankliniella fusca]
MVLEKQNGNVTRGQVMNANYLTMRSTDSSSYCFQTSLISACKSRLQTTGITQSEYNSNLK